MKAKEVSQLEEIIPDENTLVPMFSEKDGLGKVTLENAKERIGCSIDEVHASAEQGGVNTDPSAIVENTGTDNHQNLHFGFTIPKANQIENAEQTKSSTLSGEENIFTLTMSDGTQKEISVYNGARGKDFRISKTYTSISEMEDDFNNVELYDFAMIDTGSVEDEDTGKLYCRESDKWNYIGDLSGSQGIKGETGNGIASVGYEIDENNDTKCTFTMTDGTSSDIVIKRGEKGEQGERGEKGEKGDSGEATNVVDAVESGNMSAVTSNAVAGSLNGKLDKSGGTMTGPLIAMAGLRVPTSVPSSPVNGDIWIS